MTNGVITHICFMCLCLFSLVILLAIILYQPVIILVISERRPTFSLLGTEFVLLIILVVHKQSSWHHIGMSNHPGIFQSLG